MAMLAEFTSDIFLSYSHRDNKDPDETKQWIERFYRRLDFRLQQLMGAEIAIWWDEKKLDGTKRFDDSIKSGVRGSAIILCLISNHYLNSDWCIEELDLFHRKSADERWRRKVGEHSRIVYVRMQDILYTEARWPKELEGTTGFDFYDPGKQQGDLGFPLNPNDAVFEKQIQTLTTALRRVLLAFKQNANDLPHPDNQEPDKHFTVFFGDVTDSLQDVRNRTVRELKENGMHVVFNVPPPWDHDSHEREVRRKLEEAQVSVHLLSQQPGRLIENRIDEWYPCLQTQLAIPLPQPKIIWVPSNLQTTGIEQEGYKTLLSELEEGKRQTADIDFIRGDQSNLPKTILDAARQLRTLQLSQQATERAVLLDSHVQDQHHAWKLSKELKKNDILSYVNPHEDSPQKNNDLLARRAGKVKKVIFFFGDVSAARVIERINALVKLIANNEFAIEEFIVLLVPPQRPGVELPLKQRLLKITTLYFDSSPEADPILLRQLIDHLKAQPQ